MIVVRLRLPICTLALALVALKLDKLVDASWFLVLLPLWLYLAFITATYLRTMCVWNGWQSLRSFVAVMLVVLALHVLTLVLVIAKVEHVADSLSITRFLTLFTPIYLFWPALGMLCLLHLPRAIRSVIRSTR
jgi:hypothetical protein